MRAAQNPLAGKRILHLIGDSRFGGDTIYLLALAERARQCGAHVWICTTDPATVAAAGRRGFPVIGVPYLRREIEPVNDLRSLVAVARLCRRYRFDLVHTHTSKGGVVGRIAARLAGVPRVVHTIQGFAFHAYSRPWQTHIYSVIERMAGRFCDLAISVNHEDRETALARGLVPPDKIVTILNGIDPGRFRAPFDRAAFRRSIGVGDAERLVGAVARMASQKDPRTFVVAAELLTRARPDIRCVFVGDGPLFEAMRRLARERQLGDRLLLPGFQSDVENYVRALDVFVLCSLWEGLPISLLEAMCAGVPIVATRIKGNRECVDDSCALLVPPQSPHEIADAVRRLLDEPDLAERLVARGRRRFEERFEQERMLGETFAWYERLLAPVTAAVRRPRDRAGKIAGTGAWRTNRHQVVRKKILYVSNSAWDLYHCRLRLMLELRKLGYEVVACAPRDKHARKFDKHSIRFIHLPMTLAGRNPVREAVVVLRLAALYLRERPVLVHHFAMKAVTYGSMAARAARVPSIVNSITGLGMLFGRGSCLLRGLVILLLRWACAGRAHLIFQNADDQRIFIDQRIVDRKNSGVVPGSGVDLTRFAVRPRDTGPSRGPAPTTFLMYGRMIWEKGVCEYVAAAQALRAKHRAGPATRPLRFLLVGGATVGNRTGVDPEWSANPSTVPGAWLEQQNSQGCVEWFPHTDDVVSLIHQSDVVVLPSYYREGIPRSLVEAMACGKAVITTDTPGCRDTVEPGVNGLLIEPRSVQALAAAMERLALHPEQASEMGSAGRRIAERRFADAVVVRGVLGEYERAGLACAAAAPPPRGDAAEPPWALGGGAMWPQQSEAGIVPCRG